MIVGFKRKLRTPPRRLECRLRDRDAGGIRTSARGGSCELDELFFGHSFVLQAVSVFEVCRWRNASSSAGVPLPPPPLWRAAPQLRVAPRVARVRATAPAGRCRAGMSFAMS